MRICRIDLIQYLLFPDDNTQCQPFDQLFHHEIQDNLVNTDISMFKSGRGETLWAYIIMPKNTMQCSNAGEQNRTA